MVFQSDPFHVRDVRKKEFLPNAVDGIMLEPMIAGINEEWNRYEEQEIANIKKQLEEKGVNEELEVKIWNNSRDSHRGVKKIRYSSYRKRG